MSFKTGVTKPSYRNSYRKEDMKDKNQAVKNKNK